MKPRRETLFKKFATKTLENPRYTDWFPLKSNVKNTRNPRYYLETRATSDRLYKSPIFAMRRILNEQPAIRMDPADLTGIFNEP